MRNVRLIRLLKAHLITICQIGISLFGLGLLAIMTFHLPTSTTDYHFPKEWVGSIFVAICLLGIIAAASPSRCSRPKNSRSSMGVGVSRRGAIGVRGHHPTCERFSTHVFQIKGKMYCTGCTGLAMGAVISTLGSSLYFFLGFRIEGVDMFVFWLGFVAVGVGLMQYYLFRERKRTIHFVLNVTFVVGVFLLLVGVNEINQSYVLQLFLFSLIIYWIITRITISQIEHENVCVICGLKSCPFS